MKAFVRSDLRQFGTDPVEGTPVVAEQYYVVVEDKDGARWAHDHNFDDVEDAIKLEAKVQDRLDVLGKAGLNMDHWAEADPCYGSAAHQRVGDWHLMDQDDWDAIHGR
jgi:hypothetical protein